MTEVRKDDKRLIHSPADVHAQYAGNGLPAAAQTIGMETEICLYHRAPHGRLRGASARECFNLVAGLTAAGYPAQLEMASALEYASPAFGVTDLARMNATVSQDYAVFLQAIAAAGLSVGTAQLPFATLETARANLVDRERARGLVEGMSRFKHPSFLKVTLLCTSTQVSLSYADADDLYQTLAIGYALSPVIFALFADHPAFVDGGKDTRATHPRAAWYGDFGAVGGIPDSFLQASDGADFIRRHAEQVFANEMLFYYDAEGTVVWPEKPLPFRDLATIGLNTQSNYDLAESFLYHDLKVCNIRDENGVPTGKRVEFRGFDGGTLGALTAHGFIGLLLRDPPTTNTLQHLLRRYGMTPDCADFAENLVTAREAAAHHGGKFMDVRYGRGNLKAFCAELAEVLYHAASSQPALLTGPLQTLLGVARTGCSRAAFAVMHTPDYATACNHLRDPRKIPANAAKATAPKRRA